MVLLLHDKNRSVYVFDDQKSKDYARVTLPSTTRLLDVKDCYFGRKADEPRGAFGLHVVLSERRMWCDHIYAGVYTDMRMIEDFMDAHEALNPEDVVGNMMLRGYFKGRGERKTLVGIVEPKQKVMQL